jgi:hypothetical protein
MTGISRTLDIPISQKELERWAVYNHPLSQFTKLNQEQIEFVTTGNTNEDWGLVFSQKVNQEKDAFNARHEFSEQEPATAS